MTGVDTGLTGVGTGLTGLTGGHRTLTGTAFRAKQISGGRRATANEVRPARLRKSRFVTRQF